MATHRAAADDDDDGGGSLIVVAAIGASRRRRWRLIKVRFEQLARARKTLASSNKPSKRESGESKHRESHCEEESINDHDDDSSIGSAEGSL